MPTKLVVFFLLILLFPSLAWGADLSVSPAKQHLTISSTQNEPVKLIVRNHSTKNTTINIETRNLDSSSTSRVEEWVTYTNNNFNLNANSSQEVMAEINPSNSVPSGAYSIGLVVSASDPSVESQNATVDTQITSTILINYFSNSDTSAGIEGIDLNTEALEISSYKINNNYFWPQALRVEFNLKNNSKFFGVPHGLVRLTNSKGEVVKQAKINISAKELMPEQTAEYYVDISKPFFTTGNFNIEIIASLQEEKPAVMQKNVFLFPWVGVLILLLIYGGFKLKAKH